MTKSGKENIRRYRFTPTPKITGGLLLVLLLVYGITYSTNYLKNDTALFQVETVKITGNQYLSEADILEQIQVQSSQLLFKLPVKNLIDNILQNKYIRGVSISRSLPSTLIIAVQERHPVFYLIDKNLYMVDRSGIILKKLPTMPMEKVPVVTGLSVSKMLQNRTPVFNTLSLLEKISEVDANLFSIISEIHFSQSEWPELFLVKGGARVQLGDAHHYERLFLLSELMNNTGVMNRLEDIKSINLLFENRIIIEHKS